MTDMEMDVSEYGSDDERNNKFGWYEKDELRVHNFIMKN